MNLDLIPVVFSVILDLSPGFSVILDPFQVFFIGFRSYSGVFRQWFYISFLFVLWDSLNDLPDRQCPQCCFLICVLADVENCLVSDLGFHFYNNSAISVLIPVVFYGDYLSYSTGFYGDFLSYSTGFLW